MAASRPIRKRHSTAFFRDQQAEEKPPSRKSLPTVLPTSTDIPEVLIAPDGRNFYPCRYCCKAFAYKKAQISHIRFCSLGPDDKVQPVKRKSSNKLGLTAPELLLTPIKCEPDVKPPKQKRKSTNSDLIPPKRIKKEDNNHTEMPVLQPMTSTPITIKKNPPPTSKRTQTINIHKPTCCKVCKKLFPNAYECLKHKQSAHLEDSMKVSPDSLTVYNQIYLCSDRKVCPICTKPTKASSWNRHLSTHNAQKNYKCDYCQRQFHRRDHLKNHLRTHFQNEKIEEL